MIALQKQKPKSIQFLPSLNEFFVSLTLKGPITTAADDKFCNIFLNFRKVRYDIPRESSANRRLS